MIDTIKAYFECWKVLDQFRSRDNDVNRPLIKLESPEFHHHFTDLIIKSLRISPTAAAFNLGER